MKMESDNNVKTTTTTNTSTASKLDTDSGKLTFGPAW
jgi:hypothetical protein